MKRAGRSRQTGNSPEDALAHRGNEVQGASTLSVKDANHLGAIIPSTPSAARTGFIQFVGG